MKYFNGKLSQGFVALYSGRMIQFTTSGLLGIFIPIFLLTRLNYKVEYVFLWYLIGHLVYALALPIGAQFLNKIGLRRSLRISILFGTTYYVCFYFFDSAPSLFYVLTLIVLTFDRLLFWLPFHTDFAKFTSKFNRGKEVSMLWATRTFMNVVLPVVSGYLIMKFNFKVVFIIAIFLYLSSLIPFFGLPRTKEKCSWSVTMIFKKYFSRENRKLVLANMANGAENVVGMVIWPIFIWQLLNGDYFNVGIISSLIIVVAVVIQLFAGKYTDLIDKRKMIRWGSVLYALGWVIKIFILTGWQIFLAGAYHRFAKIFKDTPFDTLNYEIMADHGHFVDEYTILKEMGIQIGKSLMLVFAIVVAINFGLNWTFALAALASLFINLL